MEGNLEGIGRSTWDTVRERRRREEIRPRLRPIRKDRSIFGYYDTKDLEMPTLAKYERLCQ